MIAFLLAIWRRLRTLWEADRPLHGDCGPAPHEQTPSPPGPEVRLQCCLRIPQALLNQMRADLNRPHAFAHERVGFLLAGEADRHDGKILMARLYEPVRENEYIPDTRVGARINRDAIRRMLTHALAGESVFHVHLHEHRGRPEFSRVDEKNLHELIPSFCAVAAQHLHGALLLSTDQGIAWCWKAGRNEAFPVSVITIVGYPLLRWEVMS